MDYRTIIVHLDASRRCAEGDPQLTQEWRQRHRERASEALCRFREHASREGLVSVVVVNPDTSGDHGAVPGADIALYLARHGVMVEVEERYTRDVEPGTWLVSRARDLGADLLVMGGYGHSQFREILFGGVTRSVMGQMTLPVLMAH